MGCQNERCRFRRRLGRALHNAFNGDFALGQPLRNGCNRTGPVMQVETCRDVDDAIVRIQRGPSPLALYYFGRDAAEERRVLERTRSGGVTLNDVVMHVAALDAPFKRGKRPAL